MENPLTNVYHLESCNACGRTYAVTLYDIYREAQVAEEWQPARPCSLCDAHWQRLVAAVPRDELAAAMGAWERLAAALNERGLRFVVSAPEPRAERFPALSGH